MTEDLNQQSLGIEHWKAIWTLFERPWFSRVWIIQEFALAPRCTFHCGDIQLSREIILGLRFKIQHSPKLILRAEAASAKAASISRLFALLGFCDRLKEDSERTLLELLRRTVEFEATDPRDKVFGLVGLCTDVKPDFIDYSQKFEVMVIKLARLLVMQQDVFSGSLLLYVDGNLRISNVPSWVPLWRSSIHYHPAMIHDYYPDYFTSRGDEGATMVDASNHLHIRALLFDNIKTIGKTTPGDADFETAKSRSVYGSWDEGHADLGGRSFNQIVMDDCQRQLEFFDECWDLIRSSSRYTGSDSLTEVYWRCLLWNATSRGKPAPIEYEKLHQNYHRFCSLMVRHRLMDKLNATRSIFSRNKTFEYHHAVHCWNLLFATLLTVLSLREKSRPQDVWQWAYFFALWGSLHLSGRAILSNLSFITNKKRAQEELRKIDFQTFIWEVHDRWQGRSFAVTENGFVGMIPTFARVGDQLCYLYGSEIPFIIRPTGSQDWYTLVGSCYLHGLMDYCRTGIDEDLQERMIKII